MALAILKQPLPLLLRKSHVVGIGAQQRQIFLRRKILCHLIEKTARLDKSIPQRDSGERLGVLPAEFFWGRGWFVPLAHISLVEHLYLLRQLRPAPVAARVVGKAGKAAALPQQLKHPAVSVFFRDPVECGGRVDQIKWRALPRVVLQGAVEQREVSVSF